MTANQYVFHPINAFHLILRTAKWLPKLFPDEGPIQYMFEDSDKKIGQAAYGIVDLQEFHDLKMMDIIQGVLHDPPSGRIFKSYKNLSLDEVLLIADSAKTSGFLDRVVEWYETALSMALDQNADEKTKKDIQTAIHQDKIPRLRLWPA